MLHVSGAAAACHRDLWSEGRSPALEHAPLISNKETVISLDYVMSTHSSQSIFLFKLIF